MNTSASGLLIHFQSCSWLVLEPIRVRYSGRHSYANRLPASFEPQFVLNERLYHRRNKKSKLNFHFCKLRDDKHFKFGFRQSGKANPQGKDTKRALFLGCSEIWYTPHNWKVFTGVKFWYVTQTSIHLWVNKLIFLTAWERFRRFDKNILSWLRSGLHSKVTGPGARETFSPGK